MKLAWIIIALVVIIGVVKAAEINNDKIPLVSTPSVITGGDCPSGYVVQNITVDGSPQCVPDQTGAGGGSSYNETYDTWAYNQSQPFYDFYALFGYNQSQPFYDYYAIWGYNQTQSSSGGSNGWDGNYTEMTTSTGFIKWTGTGFTQGQCLDTSTDKLEDVDIADTYSDGNVLYMTSNRIATETDFYYDTSTNTLYVNNLIASGDIEANEIILNP